MKQYIFNINRFLIEFGKREGNKEWKNFVKQQYDEVYSNQYPLFNWARACHGKVATMDDKGVLWIDDFIIDPAWCEVKGVKENV